MEKKEAMKILKDFHDNSALFSVRTALDTVLPALKESEDERIRKAISQCVFDMRGQFEKLYSVHHKDALAWLEKQAEYANFLNKIQIGDKVTRNRDGVLVNLSQLNRVAKPEQKPEEWSEEDEEHIQSIEHTIRCMKAENIDRPDVQDVYVSDLDWLKSLKDRVQSKQEWSEEDCNQIETIACHLDNIGNGAMAESLLNIMDKYKSLRLQNTWKPSDEQMAVLNEVINYAANSELQHWSSFIYTLLKSLREQLKKLREE